MQRALEGEWKAQNSALSDRVSEYLIEIATLIADVEAAIGSTVERHGILEPETVKTLQKLDFARQAIQDTARLASFSEFELKASEDQVRLALHLERTVKVIEDLQVDQVFSSGDVEMF